MSTADADAAEAELFEIQRLFALWSDHVPEFRDRWPDIKRARAARQIRDDLAAVHGQSDPASLTALLESHPAVTAVTDAITSAGYTPTLTVMDRADIDAAPDRKWNTEDAA